MRKISGKRYINGLGLFLTAALLLVGCTGQDNRQSSPTLEEPAVNDVLSQEEIIALVKADLAFWKGVEIDEIGAPSVEEQTWGDTSLGCPEEGLAYAEVLTPGYRIILAVGGPASIEQFDYRTDTLGNFILCE